MLSKEELSLVANKQFILTKLEIIDKVYALFGAISEGYRKQIECNENIFPKEGLKNAPRISKGEKYLQMPWVMLDYPACFSKSDVFAIRSFFWWGNFFSITIHLSGKHKNLFEEKIFEKRQLLKEWLVYMSEDEWQHDVNKNTHISFLEIKKKYIDVLGKTNFLKISKTLPLSKWDEAEEFFKKGFEELMLSLK